ncbi:hypothetical protein Q6264_30840, partial [Klebsiella pneumoniae]|uniref:hypothetical protein n=1 Tax=Klebsiella pneumoniae TaxID=573 RepID=UPI00272F22A0
EADGRQTKFEIEVKRPAILAEHRRRPILDRGIAQLEIARIEGDTGRVAMAEAQGKGGREHQPLAAARC